MTLKDTLAKIKMVLTDTHVVYASGKHGNSYVNKDAIYPHTKEMTNVCYGMAQSFANEKIDVVLGPAIGGVILSQWVAWHLTHISNQNVLAVYAEKTEDGFIITRGYDQLIADKNVLVVEDVLTTGASAKKVIEACRGAGGYVVGLAALCNRGKVTTADLGDIPHLRAAMDIELDSWEAKECPLCERGVPINTRVGKGREFVQRKEARLKVLEYLDSPHKA